MFVLPVIQTDMVDQSWDKGFDSAYLRMDSQLRSIMRLSYLSISWIVKGLLAPTFDEKQRK
jgi:hypothetical protein